MKELVAAFTQHLREALTIGQSTEVKKANTEIHNVLISGLGGSGIGGTIVSQLVADEMNLPAVINKDYSIPSFVSKNTLFIACSYSGNTEETLYALEAAEKKGAEIACITSGGTLEEIAKAKGYNHIVIPGGHPPRAAFGFAFPQLFAILNKYGLIGNDFISQVEKAITRMDGNEKAIQEEAKKLAEALYQKTPVIYSDAKFEGVCVRFRQQVNENSKMLCWHHAIPEMNHNELVGWAGGNNDLAVVIFRNESDYYRTQKRIEINKEIISKYTSSITEVYSKGDSNLERALYLIHLGDWASVYLAEMKDIDATEVNVITGLKNALSEI